MISSERRSPETLLHQVGARLNEAQLRALQERVEVERSTTAAVVRQAIVEHLERYRAEQTNADEVASSALNTSLQQAEGVAQA